jgi:PAP2 superfamily
MKKITFLAANLVLSWAILSCALFGQNVVTDWATIVQPAINTPAKLPAIQMVLRAMVQIAVYDAVVAIEGGYRPFATALSAPRGADVRAAVATAAYFTALDRVAASQIKPLEDAYTAYMTTIPDGLAKTDGVAVGVEAAAAVIKLRSTDGMTNVVPYACSSNPPQPGEFAPNGGCDTQPLGTNVGQIRPFTFNNPAQFRPDGPDPLTSNAYVEDFIETRDFGRLDSAVRTAEQTDIAYFWQAVDTHKALTELAIRRGLGIRDAARFLAMVYTAAADANIAGFEAKYFYRAWRPRTAIPGALTDGNPDTDKDESWTPLISVNHPEYPSAHSYSSTAITDTMARFFGTNKVTWTLTASRDAFPQLVRTERTYSDLNALMREIYDARVWAGLHWRHSMMHGAQVGRKVSKYVCDNFFLPAP